MGGNTPGALSSQYTLLGCSRCSFGVGSFSGLPTSAGTSTIQTVDETTGGVVDGGDVLMGPGSLWFQSQVDLIPYVPVTAKIIKHIFTMSRAILYAEQPSQNWLANVDSDSCKKVGQDVTFNQLWAYSTRSLHTIIIIISILHNQYLHHIML